MKHLCLDTCGGKCYCQLNPLLHPFGPSLARQPPAEKSEGSGQLSIVDSYQWNAMTS